MQVNRPPQLSLKSKVDCSFSDSFPELFEGAGALPFEGLLFSPASADDFAGLLVFTGDGGLASSALGALTTRSTLWAVKVLPLTARP